MVMLPTLLYYYWGPREMRDLVGKAEASSAQCRMATVMHEIAERDR